jgi:hypothetical protein
MRFKILTLAALCLLAALFPFSNVFAQTAPTPQFALRTDLIPPSPNVASLGKYGIVPVSMQTGNPNISIPITEVSGKQLKVPISLSYNNNGFKPAEAASWVGWGWALNCGGVITRIVRDKVDEFVSSPYRYEDIKWRYTTHDSVTRKFMDQAMYDNTVDTEPDVYTYNFGGYSGKFFFAGGVCHQYPYNQLNISYLSPAEGFVIITPDGTEYTFSVTEHSINPHDLTTPQHTYVLPTDYISSWHLQTIRSADYKDVITFTYSAPVEIDQRGPASQGMALENLIGGGTYANVGLIGFAYPRRVKAIQLTQITSSKMTVVFNAATARLDMPTPQLDNIDIKNYQGTVVNRFKFNYGYFSDPTNTLVTHRLKLLGVDEGVNTATLKKHSFYYNGGLSGSPYVAISNKYPAVDDWGYSNGPDISETGNMMPNTISSAGVSKAPSMAYSQQTVLNKIIYPTGGVSVFEYEPNIYNPGNGPAYVYNSLNVNNYISRADTTLTNVITSSTQSFQLLEAQYVKVNWRRIPKDPQGYVGGRLPTDPTKNMTPDVTITGSQAYNFSILVNSDNAGKTDSVLLQPGTYSVYLTCDSKENYIQGSVTYKVKTTQVITGTPGPGLRILRISNYLNSAGIGTSASVKEYSYQDSTGLSTGVLLNLPNYFQGDYSEEQYKTWFPEVHNYRNYSATSGNSLNITQDMYYKMVYEKQVNGSDYLLSKSEFTAFGGAANNSLSVELVRKTDFKKVGSVYKPVQKQEYNYDQDVTETGLYIGIKPHLSIRRIPCCDVPPSPSCGVTEDRLREYTYDNWNTVPSFLRLKSQRQVSYVNTGDSVVTASTYVYSTPLRNKVLASTTDSKGITRVEKYKYPWDYIVGTTVGTGMVIEKQSWLKRSATDSVMTDGVITDYYQNKPYTLYSFANLNPVSSLNQETKNAQGLYTTLLSDTRYKPRITNAYDAGTGNLNAQDITGYYPTFTTSHQVVYLWGYHNNYPIVQVKNAALTAVAYTSFEDDDNSWTYTAANVVSTDARTGVKCYNGTISKSSLPSGNYKVSLWGKGSTTITIGGVAKTLTGTWVLYEWTLTGITSISISSNGNLIDEVRLCPANAQMTTYTYLPLTGVSSSTDAKGMSTYFEYDDSQRLVNIKDRQGNILKSYDYNYAGQGAVWQDNGMFQCVKNGVSQNTGEQQKQQVDTNPYSPTYNQTQWVSNGANTTACPLPPTIYVNVSVGSTSVSNGLTYNTYVFKSYSDANCTVPYNVPVTLTINYRYVKNATYNDGRTPNPEVTTTNSTVTIAYGTNQGTSGSLLSSGCFTNSSIQICYSSSVTVQPGTGYVPVNPEI